MVKKSGVEWKGPVGGGGGDNRAAQGHLALGADTSDSQFWGCMPRGKFEGETSFRPKGRTHTCTRTHMYTQTRSP